MAAGINSRVAVKLIARRGISLIIAGSYVTKVSARLVNDPDTQVRDKYFIITFQFQMRR